MAARVVMADDMTVYASEDEADVIVAYCERKLRFTDPEYTSMKRAGLFIPYRVYNNRHFYAMTKEWRDEIVAISLPRGFWHRLKGFLKKSKISYQLEDNTVERPLKKKLKYAIPVDIRDYQDRCVTKAIYAESGVIVAPCGSGKTQMLTEIIRRLQQRTLIIVNTDDLMQQMAERLSVALGIEVGIVKQDRMDIKPVTVASVQTLSRRLRDDDLPRSFIRKWGCVMLDESHHMPAESFSEVMTQFPAKYRFGTTATPNREDRLHGLMYAIIGYRVAEVSYQELYDGNYLMPAKVIPIPTKFNFIMSNRRQYNKMLEALVNDKSRNKLIIRRLYKSRKRYNLVLSRRIEHLELLYGGLIEKHPELEEKAALLTGRMSRKDRDEVLWQMRNGNINYIFATQLADEGLDLPILDKVHLPFPGRAEGKIQQQIGRIQRTHPDKTKIPEVNDYVDEAQNTLRRQFSERRKVYEKTGCVVSMKDIKTSGLAVRRFSA